MYLCTSVHKDGDSNYFDVSAVNCVNRHLLQDAN